MCQAAGNGEAVTVASTIGSAEAEATTTSSDTTSSFTRRGHVCHAGARNPYAGLLAAPQQQQQQQLPPSPRTTIITSSNIIENTPTSQPPRRRAIVIVRLVVGDYGCRRREARIGRGEGERGRQRRVDEAAQAAGGDRVQGARGGAGALDAQCLILSSLSDGLAAWLFLLNASTLASACPSTHRRAFGMIRTRRGRS